MQQPFTSYYSRKMLRDNLNTIQNSYSKLPDPFILKISHSDYSKCLARVVSLRDLSLASVMHHHLQTLHRRYHHGSVEVTAALGYCVLGSEQYIQS